MASKITHLITYVQKQEIWLLEEVKNYLRVSHNYDDKMILSLIDAAISEAESFTGLSLNSRKIKILITEAPNAVEIKYSPVLEILSAFSSSTGKGNVKDTFGYIDMRRFKFFLDRKFIGSDLEIEYLSGYRENVPRAISHGILMRIAAMYDRTEEPGIIDKEIKNLYLPFRPFRI